LPATRIGKAELTQLYRRVNHGTFLHIAHEEGLILNGSSLHAGIRGPLARRKGDVRNDRRCGFEIIKARDLDDLGVRGVIQKIADRVTGTKVYISVDIDVLDPAFAPGMFRPGEDMHSLSLYER
jgi:agmatinase